MDDKGSDVLVESQSREVVFFSELGSALATGIKPFLLYIIGGICLIEIVATLMGVSPILALFLTCLAVVWSAVIAAANS